MKLTVSKKGNEISRQDFDNLVSENENFTIQIGRSPDCHIHLDDKKISRVIAELEYSNSKWYMKSDLQIHPLTINHIPVTPIQEIRNSDILRVTDFVIEFELPEIVTEPVVEKSDSKDSDGDSTILIPDDIPNDDLLVEDEEAATMMMDVSPEELEEEPVENLEDLEELDLDSGEGDIALDHNQEAEHEDFNSQNEEHEEVFGEGEAGSEDDSEDYDQNYEDGEIEEFDENVNSEGHTDQYEENYDDGVYDEGAYGEEDYEVAEYDEDSTQVMTEFANYSLELFGEYAPYDAYNITENEIFIGRDSSKCQIILNDPEVSTVHAVIKRMGAICVLEDKQSANGTILNGKRINSTQLVNEDEFIIGSTTFTVRVGNEFIDIQKSSLMPVAENQEVVVEEIVEVSDPDEEVDEEAGETMGPSDNSLVGKFKALPPIRKAIYVVVALGVAFVLLDEEDSGKPKPKANTAQSKERSTKDVRKKSIAISNLSPEQIEERNSFYVLAKQDAEEGKFEEAKLNIDKALKIDPNYVQAKQLSQVINSNLARIAELNAQKRKELERERLKKEVKELVVRATRATEERNVGLAQNLYQQIKIKDPRNFEVSNLEADLNAWLDAENKKKLEEAQRKSERKRMIDALKPGETLVLKEQWYQAIIELEKFLRIKEMDEDLVKKGAQLLKDSKENLNGIVNPLLGKARSLKEGEDLKSAYEAYSEVLKYDPSLNEAISEMDDINDTLTVRSRRVYRDAIISESLGLFEEAKQKFQEVQQIAPRTNEYYKKASNRLESLL